MIRIVRAKKISLYYFLSLLYFSCAILIKFMDMKKLFLFVLFLLLGLGEKGTVPFFGGELMANGSIGDNAKLANLLPLEINGWSAGAEDGLYNSETIFDYIDGAGEVYRSYNFKQLLARRYTRKGKPDLVADLFDMGSSADAFGVFTHDLEGDEAGIGQGSTYNGGLLSFWKDRFFVSLYAEQETDEVKEALFDLGRMVASSIKGEGEKPGIVSLLPVKSLAEKGVHYFHNHLILNYHFYVSEQNILFLDQQTETALGAYRADDKKYYLLLIRYQDTEKALKAYESFIKAYMPDAREPGLVKTEDLQWTGARLKKDFLLIIFNAPSDFFAKEMLDNIQKRIS